MSPSPDDSTTGPAQAGDRRQRWALAIWIAAAVALFWVAPRPPEAPGPTPDQEAARQRLVEWALRDAERWQAQRGDVVIPWNEADGHLAILIDDVGRETYWHERLQGLRYRLTFSVLPGAVYAPGAQLRLRQDHRRYREIMLHLPMEPLDPAVMSEGAEAREAFLLADDSPEDLAAKTWAALERVPAAVGVNNHMGSRLTTDVQAMRAVMSVLKERDLFFIDSRTTAQTQAESVALELGIASTARGVFLDHVPDPEVMEAALADAVAQSRRQPTIVIAHPSQEVLDLLTLELPRLAEARIGIYPVSELLAHRSARSAGG
jgi:hypothetical protein